MNNIAVIGVGNIGTYHLKSINEIGSYNIFAVESKEKQREKIKKDFPKVTLLDSIEKLPEQLDVAVIATSSAFRRQVFEELVKKSQVSYILFEKFLFQKEEDYRAVFDTLKKKEISAWVNTARREEASYIELKKKLLGEDVLDIHISGGEWGLACNAVHMLDLIKYLTDAESNDFLITNNELLGPIIPSKREGYYEFYGSLRGISNSSRFSITCYRDSSLPINIFICTKNNRYLINERKNIIYYFSDLAGFDLREEAFPIEYVSQITGRVVSNMINEGKCHLPMYLDSMDTHLKYLREVKSFLSDNGMEGDICPIT